MARQEGPGAGIRRPHVIAPFGLDRQVRAALGYVDMAVELDAQFEEAEIDPAHVFVAGANNTPPGRITGLCALGRRAQVTSISPIRREEERALDIARIADPTARALGLDLTFAPTDFIADGAHAGERYGLLTPKAHAALRLDAETEGILLDPVRAGKPAGRSPGSWGGNRPRDLDFALACPIC